MALIEGSGLTKVYGLPDRRATALAADPSAVAAAGGTLAADHVDLDVDEGELFVLMGLSGSGKSTLLRMINRLVEPTAGTLRIDGADVTAMSEPDLRTLRNQRVSMVFQHFALFPHRTVRQNAAYGLEVRGEPARERLARADEALERVGLGDRGDASPGALSGGQRQRVGLARALATDADILLMDEPFSALDPLIRRDMQDLLLDLQSERPRTIVFVTHDLNEAMRIGRRIMVLRDGRVQQCGTGPQILAAPANPYVEEFVADVDRSRVLTASAVMRPAPDDLGEYHAVPPEAPVLEFLHLAGHPTVPVAVVADGELLGVVPPDSLLTALGGNRA
ncbi:quaternary amine ABC transporter ATP-binding protein [Cryptosporangium phraense]|uniref:Betaine/proline/choline family ABC transporter ATP-binding protein n=1 Tax=Cryptosporangium phraense TaxID=2593070 RepID=A0A545ALE5_9ACTN|nr:betaine/proline/choline family ABC transporter ATP-binding protein [Cryptosporangium phraense]TQS42111.1 betaine/proline/choline family ABC transporter ATP-binding protein [Cryptosporangium phraense]